MSLPPWNPRPAQPSLGLVSQLLQQPGPSAPQPRAQSHLRIGSVSDALHLANPLSLFRGLVPAIGSSLSFRGESPAQQIVALGQKYGVANRYGNNLDAYQSDVVKAIIRVKAREYGIPEQVAMGISGNESGWKMWKNVSKAELVQGRNVRDGELKSTDWGAMQLNDKAHAGAFPRAKQDLEFNIDYALKFLARQRKSIRGDMGMGFGDWDRTVASYNLGHNPSSNRDYQIASRYVGNASDRAFA